MSTCTINIYNKEFIEQLATDVIQLTNAYNGRNITLTQLAKSLGLKIYKAVFSNNEINGMLKIENGKYNIYVNMQQRDTRQRFTIAHEIAHFLIHREIILKEKGSILYRKDFYSTSEIETQANMLAAALLMPRELVLNAWHNLNDIDEVAEIFGTSREATYIRLNNLGVLNGKY